MKYFAKIRAIYVPKNKAHKEIQDYVLSIDSNLLNSEEHKNRFIADIKEKLTDINTRNNRCKDIFLGDWYSSDHAINVSVSGNFSMSIFQVKHELLLS